MRAVTGRVASSKPVSLSKASTILSRFAAESVARRDIAAYLRRASAAFDDLVSLHRDLRAQLRRPDADKEVETKKRDGLEAEVGQLGDGEVVGGEEAEDGQRKSKKKKKRDGENGENYSPEKKKEEKKKRKRREGDEVGGGLDEKKGHEMGVDERGEQRKKKKRRKTGEEA